MKIVLLGNAKSIHVIRWANGLHRRGLSVSLISLSPKAHGLHSGIHFYQLRHSPPIGYLFCANEFADIVKNIKPDLVNAHYASGYGLLARLSHCHPLLLSVWGSDIYEFPLKSWAHTWIIKSNLANADAIASTSYCMASQVKKYCVKKPLFITPFGVDVTKFYPDSKPSELANLIIVGTIKSLSQKYGIDILIKAFSIAWNKLGQPANLRLEIGGIGPDKENLVNICKNLAILDRVRFHDFIDHDLVPSYINRFDVFVALSRFDSESFGVAVIEASACGKPVLVSDAEGLAEVVLKNESGIIVAKGSIEEASAALLSLISNEELRIRMGARGRLHVQRSYSWERSLDIMIDVYKNVANK